jgi:hypothetical protein
MEAKRKLEDYFINLVSAWSFYTVPTTS